MTVNADNLVRTVQELVDKDQIQRVLFDYAFYLDMNQPEQLVDLFTEDCLIVYMPGHGAEGKANYLATLDDPKVGIGAFFAGTSHHVSNVSIDFVDEDTAHSRSVLYAWHRYVRERPDGVVMGQYHDVLVRTPDGWKIKQRELKHVGTETYHAKQLNMIARNS